MALTTREKRNIIKLVGGDSQSRKLGLDYAQQYFINPMRVLIVLIDAGFKITEVSLGFETFGGKGLNFTLNDEVYIIGEVAMCYLSKEGEESICLKFKKERFSALRRIMRGQYDNLKP